MGDDFEYENYYVYYQFKALIKTKMKNIESMDKFSKLLIQEEQSIQSLKQQECSVQHLWEVEFQKPSF